jgi:hypothetical protein
VRRSAALWRSTPGFLVVAAIDGSSVEMGGSAASIWQALPGEHDTPIEVEDVIRHLAERYDTAPATVAGDVVRVLESLDEIGCVSVA